MEEAVGTIGDSLVTVHTSWTDNADRRLRTEHSTSLYRRGVSTEKCVRGIAHEEGVLHITSRMILSEVEEGEYMLIILHLRPLGDSKP